MENNRDKIKKRYDRIAPLYDMMELIMEKGKMSNWRKRLWEKVKNNIPENRGRLLEAGVGTSCVFCSVPDPVKGLKELKRVCKNEGKIIMLEHMRTKKEPWGRLMDYFNWISLYGWGANINRRTMENIKKADLKIEEVNNLWLDIVKEIVLNP